MARSALQKLVMNYSDAELEEVDVVTNFKKAAADGIKLFPAIRIDNQKLAGIILSTNKIESFLNRNLKHTS